MKQTITLSHLDKVLFKSHTKGDLIAYYEAIAPCMIPYIKDHPLMMHRFPDGITGESFYQKNISDYFPSWIRRVPIKKKDGSYEAPLCQNKETLIYLANQACITPHVWLSRVSNLTKPDRIIFDLDPQGDDFSGVRTLALKLKELLDLLNLHSFVMTSGSRGLHIYIPIQRTAPFEQSREFAYLAAQELLRADPNLGTLEIRKEKRKEKVFIDTLRNQAGATSVAPYAVRALDDAPIAMPLRWQEVEDPHLHPQQYTISQVASIITQEDPWNEYFSIKQTIGPALRRLQKGS